MRTLLLLLALLFATPAYPADTHKVEFQAADGAVTVVLTDEECSVESVIRAIPKDRVLELKRAKVVFEGDKREACWIEHRGFIMFADEKGGGASVPMDAFSEIKRF